MMGGEITVSSEPGKGSVFILSFLAAEPGKSVNFDERNVHALPPANPNERPAPSDLGEKAVRAPVSLTGKKILVVDDNLINRRVISAMLVEHNVMIQEAENGKRALEALKNLSFDAVLMDIHMPVLDGIETFKAMQADAQLKQIPVIALTANAMSTDRDKYLSLGMDGYIAKPINYDDILSELGRVLHASGANMSANRSKAV